MVVEHHRVGGLRVMIGSGGDVGEMLDHLIPFRGDPATRAALHATYARLTGDEPRDGHPSQERVIEALRGFLRTPAGRERIYGMDVPGATRNVLRSIWLG